MGRKAKGSANHLRAWRERAKLTQEELAEKAGTTGAVISLLESGGRPLSDKWLYKLAPILGTRPGFILEFAPDDAQGDLLEAILAVPKERQADAANVIRLFNKGRG